MKIRSITVEIQRSRGIPIFYALNPLTVEAQQFAILCGLAECMIAADRIRERREKAERARARRGRRLACN